MPSRNYNWNEDIRNNFNYQSQPNDKFYQTNNQFNQ